MTWTESLRDEVDEIFGIEWNTRKGTVVPDSDTVALGSGAVELDATFLYADLAGSSKLPKACPWGTTAKILRAYLDCSTRLIRAWGGEIRSFDGDRVMAVFVGDLKNTHATSCAREIDWFMENILRPRSKAHFKSIQQSGLVLRHCVGIDTGLARAVRAGIRDNNDLIWIGKAPSFAAKLSDVRDAPYEVYISTRVYNRLPDSSKSSGGTAIWEKVTFTFAEDVEWVYRTKTTRTP